MSVAKPESTSSISRRTAVRVLPPEAAYDYEHVRGKLADPEILRGAVALAIFRAPLLAVPVGPGRQGGSLKVDHRAVGEAVLGALLGRPGFPDCRLSNRADGAAVEWGRRFRVKPKLRQWPPFTAWPKLRPGKPPTSGSWTRSSVPSGADPF
nr:DUF6302 family protein [Streptomyces alboflavus]